MKRCKSLYTFFFLLAFINFVCAGDFPCSPTIVNTSNPSFQTFNNNNNTNSGVPAPPFGGYVGPDFWFSFVMTPNLQLILNGITMVDPAVAIYEGLCTSPKLLYIILDNNCDGSNGQAVLFDSLTLGKTYLMRVWPENGTSNGTFSMYFSNRSMPSPEFLFAGSAKEKGEDCIQLTTNNNTQRGCAWFERPIDFTQPFTHRMTANFGTKNINGADGICLIYQTNGPTYCGGTGEGMGAQGMPNSAIFEFDTWSNPNLNDPAEDHASFNINGNMNHNASIQGPITFPNIEDGNDHTITFSWNPVGNLYKVVFDGVNLLNGSFDIIKNCFGGKTSAWWGYTSSTGGSNNNHIICPVTDIFKVGTQEYQEIEICEGEEFKTYTKSGFYIDFDTLPDGCKHQVNTLLTVLPQLQPTNIQATICDGDTYAFGGNNYNLSGIYTLNEKSAKGCDSMVILTLKVMSGSIALASTNDLDCNTESTNLSSSIAPISNGVISYYWQGPSGFSTSPNWTVSQAGEYSLNISVNLPNENLTCSLNDTIEVKIDTIHPSIFPIENVTLTCKDTANLFLNAVPLVDTSLYNFKWFLQDSLVGSEDSLMVTRPGEYILFATSNTNGCTSIDTSLVIFNLDLTTIDLKSQKLNCIDTSFVFNPILSKPSGQFTWYKDGILFSNALNPKISEAGTYLLEVINDFGCKSSEEVVVEKDITLPTATLTGEDIICQKPGSIHISGSTGKIKVYDISGNLIDTLANTKVNTPGQYQIEITGSNGCKVSLPYVVKRNDIIPDFTVKQEFEELNCDHPSMNLSASDTGDNLTYQWTHLQNQHEGDSINVKLSGTYSVKGVDANGCISQKTIQITVDTIRPVDNIKGNNIDCKDKIATLSLSKSPYNKIIWSGPNVNISNQNEIKVNAPGVYFVEFTGENGCKSRDTIEVVSNVTSPQLNYNGMDTIIIDIENINEKVEVEIVDDSEITYTEWNTELGLDCLNQDCSHITFTPEFLPSYTYTVTNEHGCTSELTIYLKAVEKELIITIPNIFAPDSKNGNRFFTFYGTQDLIEGIQNLRIYDRWGNLVFSKNALPINMEEEGWNGLFNGVEVCEGVYIYTGSVLLKNGKILYFHGDVTLLR